MGAGARTSRWRRTRTSAPPVDVQQLLRHAEPRLREDNDDIGDRRWSSTTSAPVHAAQPHSATAEPPRLADHRAAVRQQHEHRHRRTDWKSRDQTDASLANQTDLTARFRDRRGARTRWSPASSRDASDDENSRASRPVRPRPTRISSIPNPTTRMPGRSSANGATTEGTRGFGARYAFDTVKLGERWEVTGGAPLGSLRRRLRDDRGHRRRRRRRADRRMLSWRGGVGLQAAPDGSIYAGCGTSFNPSAEGLSLSATHREPRRRRRRATTRSARSGICSSDRLSLTARVFHTEKTNARTPGINPGDPPTFSPGGSACEGVEVGVAGRLASRMERLRRLRVHATAHRRVQHRDGARQAIWRSRPRHTFNALDDVPLPRDCTVGGGAQFMDAIFRNTPTPRGAELLARERDGRMDRELAPDAALNANNLGDTHYVDRVGGGHYIPGPGRSAC